MVLNIHRNHNIRLNSNNTNNRDGKKGGGGEGYRGDDDDELMLNVLRCHLTY